MRRGLTYGPDNVAVQPGGKPVIGKFLQVVMNPGDGVLFPTPGYPIYESQVEYFGGVGQPYRYGQTPIRVRHRPRSSAQPDHAGDEGSDLQQPAEPAGLRELARGDGRPSPRWPGKHDLWVLSDEAYFEMRYSGTSSSIASLPEMQSRTVILYTFSKKFAMTGWRLGRCRRTR